MLTHHMRRKLTVDDGKKEQAYYNGQQATIRTTSSPKSPRRKVLPTVPSPEEEKNMSVSIAKQRSPAIPNQVNVYGPYFLEYSLMAEYNQLRKQKLPGVYVIPAAKSPLVWYGVIFIRQGLYQEGIFKFTMNIPENYPDGDAPTVIFKPAIFHPVINIETGELDVKRAFPKWRRNINHLWQVLLYARRIFYKIDTQNPCNTEAATLYDKDMDAFKEKVAETIKLSLAEVYEPISTDLHAIRFSEWNADIHEKARRQVSQSQEKSFDHDQITKNAQTSGLSWVKPGTIDIFSREEKEY